VSEKLKKIILKPGREKSLKQRHPLIFSGAIGTWPDSQDGELLSVSSSTGDYLGCGYFRKDASLAGRILWFAEVPETCSFSDWARNTITTALAMRLSMPLSGNAWRLINGDSDGMPGVIIDRYAEYLVFQIAAIGMEKRKQELVEACLGAFKAASMELKGILQKPGPPGSSEPGTIQKPVWLSGEETLTEVITENGLKFKVDFVDSQKTGFFLDQRENRALIRELARNRTVLNCFSYTGGFSVYAAKGGARRVDSVDSSARAVETARDNFDLNGIDSAAHGFHTSDVFEFLRESEIEADLIILDPPAFARNKRELPGAMRGYRDIHRLAMRQINPGGIIATSSCSHPVDAALFQKIIFQAALEARRNVKIIHKHRQSPDHPTSIYFPEGEYIKGFVLFVD